MFEKVKWKNFKKIKTKSSEKLSLSEIVWFGFNYTVSVSFTAVFAALLYSQVGSNLGTHMIWIFLIEGLIAGTCAWAFARLSRVHPSSNGAAYIYTRSTYGRFWGWLIAFVQYSTLPVIITAQIISMIRINFNNPNLEFLYANWGVWTNFGLDLIGILLYVLISGILFLGMKACKIFINISGYIKWVTTLLLVIAVITLFIMSGTSNYKTIIANQKLTASSFSEAFTACFFFFLGFETYSTIGKNVQNPQKNISRSIIIVMSMATLFYVLVTILMIGAISGHFTDNPNLQIFDILGKKLNAEWLGIIGVLIMVICTISLKANSQMQNALYGGTILEPLALEGYIAPKYKELSKDKIPYRAARLNLIISLIFAFVWLVIPDLIQAISDGAKGLTKPSTVINFDKVTSEVSLIMIIIYICVITIALKLSWEKKLRHNKFEFFIWSIALIFLVWQFVMWFVNLGFSFKLAVIDMKSVDAAKNSAGVINLVSNIVQLIYLILVFLFAICWYCLYYQPKLRVRLINKTQEKYDQEFLLQDDWPFVAKNLENEIENYLKRNALINDDENNKNYKFAQKVQKELLSSEGEWKEDKG
ncbi:MAG: APC family permease [Spiroplasma sp.]